MKQLNERLQKRREISNPIAGKSVDGVIEDTSPEVCAAADDIGPLHEISTLIIREGNITALYDRVLDGAIRLMSADMGTMQILDQDSGELLLIASRDLNPRSVAFWQH